jgi:ferredoxin-type protein NapH
MRKYRNATRLAVLLGMVAIVYFNLYEKKAGQLGAEQEISDSFILSAYDQVLHQENKPMLFEGEIEGGLWSLRVFALSLSDPLAFVSSTVTSRTINSTLLLSTLIPLALVLVFGRFFCSWICPYSLFAEAGTGLRKILRRVGLEYFSFDLPKATAKTYLGLSLLLGALASVPLTHLLYPPRLLTEAVYHLIITGTITAGVFFLVFLWMGEVVFSPHLFCRRICPGGALMSILGRFRVWRVERPSPMCDSCRICDLACPYNLEPSEGNLSAECDNCGLCMDVCDDRTRHALHYVLKWPWQKDRAA